MIAIALFDADPCEQYQLDDLLAAILFSRDDFKITFYSSYTIFSCDLAQERRFFDILFVNVTTPDNAGLLAAEAARRYCKSIEIVMIGDDYRFLRFGYKVRALDYILKPYNRAQLTETIDRYYEYVRGEEYLIYKSGTAIVKTRLEMILYIFSNGRKLTIVTADGCETEFYGKLDDVSNTLEKKNFLRTHKSYLVNTKKVRMINKDKLIMCNQQEIPISRNKLNDIKNAFVKEVQSHDNLIFT